MNFRLINFISRRFSGSERNSRFMNFARLFALLSVMLGSTALIVALSVLDGFESAIKSGIMKFRSHVSVTSFSKEYLPEKEKTLRKIKSFSAVKSAFPLIENEGLIRSGSYTDGVLIRGVTKKYASSHIKENIKSGSSVFSDINASEIVIGHRLASRLGVTAGDTVFIYAVKNYESGSFHFPEIEKFRISGIYETGLAKYDDIYAYIPYKKSEELFEIPSGAATLYEVNLKNPDKARPASREIGEKLGYPFFSFSVFDLHRDIFAWIDLQKAPIPIVLTLISLVAVLNIITILLISVIEKTRSVGILKALGMNSREIVFVFVFRGVITGLLGTALGCALGFAFGIIQGEYGLISLKGEIYYLDTLPVDMKIWHFQIVAAMTILLSFLASLLPSWLSVRVKPVRALRYK